MYTAGNCTGLWPIVVVFLLCNCEEMRFLDWLERSNSMFSRTRRGGCFGKLAAAFAMSGELFSKFEKGFP